MAKKTKAAEAADLLDGAVALPEFLPVLPDPPATSGGPPPPVDPHSPLAELRAAADRLPGRRVESVSRVVQAPHPNNGGRACVEHHLVYFTPDGLVKVSGVADAHDANVPDELSRFHPAAAAEEEAERRAYLRLLGVTRGAARPPADADRAEVLLLVDSVASRVGVDPVAAARWVAETAYPRAADVPTQAFRRAFDRLSDLQRRQANETSPAAKADDRLRDRDREILARLPAYRPGWTDL